MDLTSNHNFFSPGQNLFVEDGREGRVKIMKQDKYRVFTTHDHCVNVVQEREGERWWVEVKEEDIGHGRRYVSSG